MTVQSKPMVDGQVREATTPQPTASHKGAWATGFAAIAIGAILWTVGGKYTFDGWLVWINGFFAWLQLPIVIADPVGWWRLLFIPVAFVYSRVEVRHRPFWRKGGSWQFVRDPVFWGAWLFIVGTDIGTTFTGSKQPSAQVWGMLQPAMLQIANSDVLSVAWSIVLTFAPEWLILGGVWLLKR